MGSEMAELSSLTAAWTIPAHVPRGDKPVTATAAPAGAGVGAPPSKTGATSILPKESKVKTEKSGPFSFTYTFYDAKTLEIIGHWPQAPTYKLRSDPEHTGAALETIA